MRIINTAEELVEVVKGNKEFIIYGTGNVAKTVIRFLIDPERDIKPICVATNSGERARKLKEIKEIKVKSLKKCSKMKEKCLMLVALKGYDFEKIDEDLKNAGFENNVFVSEDLFLHLSWAENVPMGFLSPGYAKCATSALNTALKQNKKIFLSKQKETNYIHWRHKYDDSPERFKAMYYPKWKKGQVLGNFEPSYHKKSEGIYECFGPDLKLIFMMRNPASATYSYFKMMMRRTSHKGLVKYYLKHRRFCMEMFEDYLNDFVYTEREDRFQYDKYINQFLRFWPKENMKFIFFEDLIKEPERIMTEVQEFIGVKPVKIEKLPEANVGSEVSKNFIGAALNWFWYVLERKVKSIPSKKIKKKYLKSRERLYKHTLVPNNEKISDETKATLIEYYMDSIKRVEEITGRDLKGVWY